MNHLSKESDIRRQSLQDMTSGKLIKHDSKHQSQHPLSLCLEGQNPLSSSANLKEGVNQDSKFKLDLGGLLGNQEVSKNEEGEEEGNEEKPERWVGYEQEEEDEEQDDEQEVISTRSVMLSLLIVALFVGNYLKFNNLPVYTQMRELAQLVLEDDMDDQSKVDSEFESYMEDKIKHLFAKPSSFVENYTTYQPGDEREFHFLNEFNYVVGVRFTARIAKYVPNQNQYTRASLPLVRDGVYSEPGSSFKGELKGNVLEVDYSERGGFLNKGGYHIYFEPTWRQDSLEFKNAITKMKEFIALPDGIEYSFGTILYNINTHASLYYTQSFASNNAGLLSHKTEHIGFTNQYYSLEAVGALKYALRLIFDLLFIFFQFIQVVQLIFILYNSIKEALQIKSCTLEWYYYIDIIVVSLVATSIVYLFLIYTTPSQNIPLADEADFDQWEAYAYTINVYYYVSSLAICFMFIRSLRILNSIFPSFSILFDTIRRSGSDLCYFLLMMVTLFVGFVFMGHFVFGNDLTSFSAIKFALMKLFLMMLGSIDYYELELISPQIAPIFFFTYMILFFFIILNMFLAIVMATHGQIQDAKGRDTIAAAQLVKIDTKQYLQKIVNLLICKEPHLIDKANHKKKSQNSAASFLQRQELNKTRSMTVEQFQKFKENREQGEQEENRNKKHEQKMKCKDIFLYNFTQVFCRSGKQMTIQEIEARRDEMKRTLEKRKEQLELDKEEDESDFKQYQLVSEGCIFIFFIVIFGTLAGLTLHTDMSYLASVAVREKFELDKYGDLALSQVRDIDGFKSWMTDLLQKSQSNPEFINYFYFFGPVQYRLTMRFVTLEENIDSGTSKVATKLRKAYDFNPQQKNNVREFTGFLGDLFPERKGTPLPVYTPSGSVHSAFKAGGYVVQMKREDQLNDVFKDAIDGLLDEKLGSIVLQFVSYNPNMQYVTISSIIFRQLAVGMLESKAIVDYMQTDIYKGSRIARVLIETLYIILTIYYLYAEITQWLRKEAEIRENERLKAEEEKGGRKENEEERSQFQRFIRYLGFDYEHYLGDSTVVKILKIVFGLIGVAFRWVFYFLKITYFHLTQDFFNMLDSCSLVLSLMNIIYWFIIIFQFYFMPENPDYIGEFEQLGSFYQSLTIILGVNSLIIFLRLLQFLKFNKKLSILSDVISSASTDAGFFLLMFTIVLLGFSILGNSLFGLKNKKFSSIFQATHTFFIMVTGDADYDELVESGDPQLSPIFFLVFMILFNLLLLNMFIAIISQHYEQIHQEIKKKEEKNKKKESMVQKICYLLRYRFYGDYYKDLFKEESNQLKLCTFCTQCCSKGKKKQKSQSTQKSQISYNKTNEDSKEETIEKSQNRFHSLQTRPKRKHKKPWWKCKGKANRSKHYEGQGEEEDNKDREGSPVRKRGWRCARWLKSLKKCGSKKRKRNTNLQVDHEIVNLRDMITPRNAEDQRLKLEAIKETTGSREETSAKLEEQDKEREEEEEKEEDEYEEDDDETINEMEELGDRENFIKILMNKKQVLDQGQVKKLKQVIDLPELGDQTRKVPKSHINLQSQSSWLRQLERYLKRVSYNKLNLNEFSVKIQRERISQNMEHNFTNLEMAYVKDKTPELLYNRKIEVLYSVFHCLRYLALIEENQEVYKDSKLTLAFFHEIIQSRQRNYSEVYKHFWDNLEEEDQYELWSQLFSSWDRAALWNSIPFSTQFFEKVSEEEKLEEQIEKEAEQRAVQEELKERAENAERGSAEGQNLKGELSGEEQKRKEEEIKQKLAIIEKRKRRLRQRRKKKMEVKYKLKDLVGVKMLDEDDNRGKFNTNLWEYLFLAEVKNNQMLRYIESLRQKYTRFLLSSHSVVKHKEREMFWLQKVSKVKSGEFRYKMIKKNYLNEGEYRIPLWFTLDNEERISLVKNQPDREEACFMFMLLMEEFKDEDSMLNWISTELEQNLDNLLYQKYSLLCQWQAVQATCRSTDKRFKTFREEEEGLKDYILMLLENLNKFDKQKQRLKKVVERQSQKLLRLRDVTLPLLQRMQLKTDNKKDREDKENVRPENRKK